MGIELIITVCMGKKKIDLNEFFFPSPQEWSEQALKVHGSNNLFICWQVMGPN
jgi:hypothetical protein